MPGYANRRASLTALSASLILMTYVGFQVVGSLGAGFALEAWSTAGPGMATPASNAPAVLTGLLLGVCAAVALSLRLGGGLISDRSDTGIAWCLGDWAWITFAIGAGATLAVVYLALIPALFPPVTPIESSPLTEMAVTRGLPQMTWILMALAIAPPAEEFLFRGVALAGFCRSFGRLPASVAVTALFVGLHVPEAMHYWPALFAITSVAVLTLALRLCSAALGPAIAAHLAYNSVIASVILAAL